MNLCGWSVHSIWDKDSTTYGNVHLIGVIHTRVCLLNGITRIKAISTPHEHLGVINGQPKPSQLCKNIMKR